MRKTTLVIWITAVTLLGMACNKSEPNVDNGEQVKDEYAGKQLKGAGASSSFSWVAGSAFIPVDSANKMIKSYLNSINYTTNNSDIRSFIVNADSLRKYLLNPDVKSLKIMMAHNLNYINTGNANQPAGYNSGALTIVISGFGANGNYIIAPDDVALNRVDPCPAKCPTMGTAANDLIVKF